MPRIYELPSFLEGVVTRDECVRWLRRKARAHYKRDRKRGNTVAQHVAYKLGIHAAVVRSEGCDEYTGRPLRWDLISQYDNDEAAVRGRDYKRELYELPTADHVGSGLDEQPEFAICSWQVNDAKHDQTYREFLDMCRAVVAYDERRDAGG